MSAPNHQRKFKNIGKSEDLRRRRAEGSVELRKTRKEDHLMKRRNVDVAEDGDGNLSEPGEVSSPECANKTAKPVKQNLSLEECMRVFKDDPSRANLAVESVRRWLSKQSNPAVNDVLDIGALPYLVQALDSKDPKVQFEAAWALTNISSGTSEQTHTVVNAGAVPRLIKLLDAEELFVAEQACWALGNITGDGADLRDTVYSQGILDAMIRLCHKPMQVEFVRTFVWCISNLCRHKNPIPPYEAVQFLVPIISQLLNYDDTLVLVDACWALAYVSDSSDDRIQLIIEQGLVPKLVELMGSADTSLLAPALRCLGNIVTGTDVQTQVVVDSGVLEKVVPVLIRSGKNIIVKEAMWLLSNIVAGNEQQIQAVLDAQLVAIVLEVVLKGDYKSQFEALWVVNNLASGGSSQQVKSLLKLDEKLFGAVCQLLRSKEAKMVALALDCLNHLLQASSKHNSIETATLRVEECGGLDSIEELQQHANENIYNKALYIIEQYFCEDEDAAGHPPNNGSSDFVAAGVPDAGFSF